MSTTSCVCASKSSGYKTAKREGETITRKDCQNSRKGHGRLTFMYLHQRQRACRYNTISFKQENIPQPQDSVERQLHGQGRGTYGETCSSILPFLRLSRRLTHGNQPSANHSVRSYIYIHTHPVLKTLKEPLACISGRHDALFL